MKVSKFERLVNERRLSPVKRVDIGGRILLVADGWLPDHPEFRGPHYQTLWALGKDEDRMQVCQPLYFGGGIGSSRQEDRIAAAMKCGIDAVERVNGRAQG